MQNSLYRKGESKARFTFYAFRGDRFIRIQAATMEAVLLRLNALCPGGSLRELWRRCAEPLCPMAECEVGVRQ